MTYHSGKGLVDPRLLLSKAQVREGMHIADLGCGVAGHVVFPASKLVRDRGIVYAVDILKNSLSLIEKRARIENALNIHTVWSDIERKGGIMIPAASLDVAFLVNVLFHMERPDTVLDEVSRILKDKGRMVIVDWKDSTLSIAPKPERLVDFPAIESWAREHGYTIQERFTMGNHHRGIILYRHA